ncbi:hypothetical protein E1A91_D06G179400v1 [Gossypium mustelinum]|uniref:Uncharacterized protein n=3 Tax=Gossypium TaxID=3633 RepID=A0A5J5RAS3_GOSBA|nr:hypothetical protein ES319_D06G178800v1 [Gossypium barbadense]TYG65502.1 hypothetical protein ES288_D06G190700v1 [Gossypium darwinii]TYI77988.1 hypothetical protein E1A91_D06G179400v1 [Gossypium mustelinum]
MQIYIYVYTLVPVNLRVIAIIIFPLLNHMKATKNKHLKLDCQKKKKEKKEKKINKKAQKSRIPCFVSSLTYIHTYLCKFKRKDSFSLS